MFLSTNGTQPSTPEVTYTYTPSGAVDKIVYEGGKQIEYGYTIRDWVESINDINNPQGSFAGFYQYLNIECRIMNTECRSFDIRYSVFDIRRSSGPLSQE